MKTTSLDYMLPKDDNEDVKSADITNLGIKNLKTITTHTEDSKLIFGGFKNDSYRNKVLLIMKEICPERQ